MALLEGVMAFAIVMIILSTIVTGVTEAILRLLATRQQVVADAVRRLLVREVLPRFREELCTRYCVANDEKAVATLADKLCRDLTLNPLKAEASDGPGGGASIVDPAPNAAGRWFRRLNDGIETLTTYSFLQRLAKTEVGALIVKEARTEQRRILVDLSRTYERYVAGSNEMFRKYAHVWTTVVAILVCFGANIDASRVFQHLMDSPASRAALIEQVDEAKTANDARTALLVEVRSKIEAGETIDQDVYAQIEEATKNVREPLTMLEEEAGLPIGFGYFPHCSEYADPRTWWAMLPLTDDPKSNDEKSENAATCEADRSLATWFVNILVAGALVSLGGPFWYRVFSSLSQLATLLRHVGGGGRREQIEKDAPEQPASAAAFASGDVVEVFRIAQSGAPPKQKENAPGEGSPGASVDP